MPANALHPLGGPEHRGFPRPLREAISKGATFLQSPEMSNLVERSRADLFAKIATEDADPFLAAARKLAAEAKVTIHLGSLAIREGEKIANRAFLIGPDGGLVARYDKLHLFDVDLPNGETWRESATYTAGACAVVAPVNGAKLGMGIATTCVSPISSVPWRKGQISSRLRPASRSRR